MQRTLVLIKPDAFRRGLVSEILGRFEKKGFKFVHMQLWTNAPRELIEQHYEEHKGKGFFTPNCDFMCDGQILSLVLAGEVVTSYVREMQGRRDIPGTIRGDLVTDIQQNLVHASDSVKSAEREIDLWVNWNTNRGQIFTPNVA